MIKSSTTDKIKETVKIVDVISDFISLRRKGVTYLGLCPFHDEKTPSFTVSPAKGIYKCFGCGESGNAISFVMRHEAMSYPEALKYLAKKYNIPIEETQLTAEEIAKRSKKESLFIITDFAQKFFLKNFNKSIAHKYMAIDRFFNNDILRNFGIGFAIEEWSALSDSALQKGFKTDFLIATGLSGKKKTGGLYDRFRNRVIFPYYDLTGRVIGFTSRILVEDKQQAKYINSINSELFDKSKVLYGLFQAKKSIVKEDCCFLVEGNTDVMRHHQIGIENTVGTSGTALSEFQVKLIQRFTSHVILLFDADNAGQSAALKSIDKFIKQDFKVEVCFLPPGEDPDSFAKNKTKDEVLKYIEENIEDFLEYQVKALLKGSENPKDIAKASTEISKTLSYIEDDNERDIYTKKLAKKFNLDKKLLNEKINKLNEKKEKPTRSFFALAEAQEKIKEKDKAFLYSDNEEVIKNHYENKANSIGFHADIKYSEYFNLKKLSSNIVFDEKVEAEDLIYKEKETRYLKILKHLVSIGFNIELAIPFELVEPGEPDKDYISFIDLYIKTLTRNINPSDDKSKKAAIEKAAEIISFLSETERMLKTDYIIKSFAYYNYKITASDFKKILASYLKNNERSSKKEITIYANNPHGLSKEQLEDLNKYGFFERDNQFYFEEKTGGSVAFSNYTIRPLFHIESTNETRKLFEILNFKNEKRIIEVDMESMIKVDKWQIYCESKGNYLFWGNKNHFIRLKQKLYADTKFCKNIENLGWQKSGFWAWADGVVADNKFTPVDEYGTLNIKDSNYYIPAFSKLYIDDKTVFKNERKFMRKQQEITFYEWSEKFINVYGDNAKLSICSLLTTIYSDFIFSLIGNLPLINLFGVKGTGKTEHAKSLLNFFGEQQGVMNIHKGTEYAAAVHLEYFKNAFAVIDEYKNTLDIKKIEYLKSIYNRDGRLRGSIKAGVKTETTQVNSMVLLCGQEMPTADVALFSRLVFLPYYNPEFTQEQKDRYNELKSIEKKGLTHLTEELLKFRKEIEDNYEQNFYDIEKALSDELPPSIDGRLIKNYTTIITTFKILEDKISLAFKYEDVFKVSLSRIKEQYNIMHSSNEVSAFWESLISLVEREIVKEGENYRIISEVNVTLKVKRNGASVDEEFNFKGRQNGCLKILYLKMNTIYNYYAELAAKTRQDIMPKKSLEYYLEHSKSFLGRYINMRFGPQVTTGWAFDYNMLGIDLKDTYNGESASGEIPEESPDRELPF